MKTIKHLRTILTHKYWVSHYCFTCGLYWQGIIHDLSKFSPAEFIESARYYQGHRSPIDACKEAKGYSKAWLHHRGRNKHHWEMWLDDFSKGTIAIKMPYKYALEMMCDYLAAGRAYYKESFSIDKEYDWWQTKKTSVIMHPDTYAFIEELFEEMYEKGIAEVLTNAKYMKDLKYRYNNPNASF